MSKKVFISYCHKQGDWVTSRLVPCLRAGGAEVLIDIERFRAGRAVIGQMDSLQDQADVTALILSPDYLHSNYCRHEMARAIARDPQFASGATLPVKHVECEMPDEIKLSNPLWINLCDDEDAAQWDFLLDACDADLHTGAPHWLARRDEALQFLQRGQSVNLVVQADPRWRELIEHLRDDHLPELRTVDLARGATASRRALVEEPLKARGVTQKVPKPPEDLVVLDRALSACPTQSRVALLHGDRLKRKQCCRRACW
jgi:hypothetical protein